MSVAHTCFAPTCDPTGRTAASAVLNATGPTGDATGACALAGPCVLREERGHDSEPDYDSEPDDDAESDAEPVPPGYRRCCHCQDVFGIDESGGLGVVDGVPRCDVCDCSNTCSHCLTTCPCGVRCCPDCPGVLVWHSETCRICGEDAAARRIQARARHYILQFLYAGLADAIKLGRRCYMSADHYMKSLHRLGTARLPRAPADSGTFSIWARKMAAIDRIQAHARHYILQSVDYGIADDVKLALYCGEAAGSYRDLLERLGTARLGAARLPKALRRP